MLLPVGPPLGRRPPAEPRRDAHRGRVERCDRVEPGVVEQHRVSDDERGVAGRRRGAEERVLRRDNHVPDRVPGVQVEGNRASRGSWSSVHVAASLKRTAALAPQVTPPDRHVAAQNGVFPFTGNRPDPAFPRGPRLSSERIPHWAASAFIRNPTKDYEVHLDGGNTDLVTEEQVTLTLIDSLGDGAQTELPFHRRCPEHVVRPHRWWREPIAVMWKRHACVVVPASAVAGLSAVVPRSRRRTGRSRVRGNPDGRASRSGSAS